MCNLLTWQDTGGIKTSHVVMRTVAHDMFQLIGDRFKAFVGLANLSKAKEPCDKVKIFTFLLYACSFFFTQL
jgi:hypothetical protein